jgi:hypothetical protein
MPFFYRAYGLSIAADRSLPAITASAVAPTADVEVWLGETPPGAGAILDAPQRVWSVSPYCDDDGRPSVIIWTVAGGSYFRLLYRDGAEFYVDRSGSWVWARWPDTLTLGDASSYLLGPVLGFLLRLRGVVCLHASAISAGASAIAFIGPSGAGKSTTAAAFARQGYRVLSDDIVALTEQGIFLAQPGYPRIRLWPESVEVLSGLTDALPCPSLPPGGSRYHLDLTQNGYHFERRALPLAAIYALDERRADDGPYVEAVPPGGSLMRLVANAYASKLLDRAGRAREFESLGRLAGRVPLRRVRPRADPGDLTNLCDAIRTDFEQMFFSEFAMAGV